VRDNLKILIVIGVVVGLFSTTIPFTSIFNGELEYIEDIIYFRGILLGFILVSIGSAAVLQGYHKIITIAIGCGGISLFIASTFNLIFDDLISTSNYFKVAFFASGGSLLVIILIKAFGVYFIRLYYVFSKKYKACWNRLSHGWRLLKEYYT